MAEKNVYGGEKSVHKMDIRRQWNDKQGVRTWTSGGTHCLPIDGWLVEKEVEFEVGDLVQTYISNYKVIRTITDIHKNNCEYKIEGLDSFFHESALTLIMKKNDYERVVKENSRD